MSKRQAIVLFNLGGPDSLEAVRPFLFNLFNDKAIFRLPQPFRSLLAAFVAKRRAPIAVEIYRHLGGGTPLLPNTERQAAALHHALGGGINTRIFIAMRYWHPFTMQTLSDVQDWQPDEIVLLPLYPQYSTTTTASSLAAWHDAAKSLGVKTPTRALCCYPMERGFARAMADLIAPLLSEAAKYGTPRLLLSAHGLPESVVKSGDPYQWQCEQTAKAIVEALERPSSDRPDLDWPNLDWPNLDWSVCYQSRVGPMKWIGPSTDSEIHRAGQDKVPLVIAPIAFVSEHSETLVEIEIEYRKLAEEVGVPYFGRVPAVGDAPDFILSLADLINRTEGYASPIHSGCESRICPDIYSGCPMKTVQR